jgi:hypothetical protein
MGEPSSVQLARIDVECGELPRDQVVVKSRRDRGIGAFERKKAAVDELTGVDPVEG